MRGDGTEGRQHKCVEGRRALDCFPAVAMGEEVVLRVLGVAERLGIARETVGGWEEGDAGARGEEGRGGEGRAGPMGSGLMRVGVGGGYGVHLEGFNPGGELFLDGPSVVWSVAGVVRRRFTFEGGRERAVDFCWGRFEANARGRGAAAAASMDVSDQDGARMLCVLVSDGSLRVCGEEGEMYVMNAPRGATRVLPMPVGIAVVVDGHESREGSTEGGSVSGAVSSGTGTEGSRDTVSRGTATSGVVSDALAALSMDGEGMTEGRGEWRPREVVRRVEPPQGEDPVLSQQSAAGTAGGGHPTQGREREGARLFSLMHPSDPLRPVAATTHLTDVQVNFLGSEEEGQSSPQRGAVFRSAGRLQGDDLVWVSSDVPLALTRAPSGPAGEVSLWVLRRQWGNEAPLDIAAMTRGLLSPTAPPSAMPTLDDLFPNADVPDVVAERVWVGTAPVAGEMHAFVAHAEHGAPLVCIHAAGMLTALQFSVGGGVSEAFSTRCASAVGVEATRTGMVDILALPQKGSPRMELRRGEAVVALLALPGSAPVDRLVSSLGSTAVVQPSAAGGSAGPLAVSLEAFCPDSPLLGECLHALGAEFGTGLRTSLLAAFAHWHESGNWLQSSDPEWASFAQLLWMLLDVAHDLVPDDFVIEGLVTDDEVLPDWKGLSGADGARAGGAFDALMGSRYHAQFTQDTALQLVFGDVPAFSPGPELSASPGRQKPRFSKDLLRWASADATPARMLEAVHGVYEGLKMHRAHGNHAGPLARTLLAPLARCLRRRDYLDHYARDFSDLGVAVNSLMRSKTDASDGGERPPFDAYRHIYNLVDAAGGQARDDAGRRIPAVLGTSPGGRATTFGAWVLEAYEAVFGDGDDGSDEMDSSGDKEKGTAWHFPESFLAPLKPERDRLEDKLEWRQVSGTSPGTRLLRCLLKNGVTHADLELVPAGLAVPLLETLACLREDLESAAEYDAPWPAPAYTLLGRHDLASVASGGKAIGSPSPYQSNDESAMNDGMAKFQRGLRAKTLSKEEAGVADGMEGLDGRDQAPRFTAEDEPRARLRVVRDLLRSSVPVVMPEVSLAGTAEGDVVGLQQKALLGLAERTCVLAVGRGAATLGIASPPLLTEPLPIPPLEVAGRLASNDATVRLDVVTMPGGAETFLTWPRFHNGCAAGLRLPASLAAKVTRTWIVYNRPPPAPANASSMASVESDPAAEVKAGGLGSPATHGGLLFALGLRGHLRVLGKADMYRYLSVEDEATTVGLLLGVASSHLSKMDADVAKMLFLHLPTRHPSSYPELEVPSTVQTAALMGIGLLYARTGNRPMAEVLCAEIGRRARGDGRLEREAYCLTAGIALGLVVLGKGHIGDLDLENKLHRYIQGGPDSSVPPPPPPLGSAAAVIAAATRGQGPDGNQLDQSGGFFTPSVGTSGALGGSTSNGQNIGGGPSPCVRVREGQSINTGVAGPGAIVALGLQFLKTGSVEAASRLALPDTFYGLAKVRPDAAHLRTLSCSMIMWNAVEPTNQWIKAQVPEVVRHALECRRIMALAERELAQDLLEKKEEVMGEGQEGDPEAELAALVSVLRGDEVKAKEVADFMRGRHEPDEDDVDWELCVHLEAACTSAASLALGLRFAGTCDKAACETLLDVLDVTLGRKVNAPPTTPAGALGQLSAGLELCDRGTLEGVVSATALALGMVMAGSGNL